MRRFAVLLVTALLAVGCTPKRAASLEAPDFTLKDLSGKTVSLKSFRGHPVLLDFWATWCGPCRVSIPNVEALYKKYKDSGLIVLGINMDDEPTPVLSFTKKFDMQYPVLFGAGTSVPGDYDNEALPMFVLIAPDGKVIDRYEGFDPEMVGMWEKQLQPFLTKKS